MSIRKKQYILNDKEHDVIHYALFNEKLKKLIFFVKSKNLNNNIFIMIFAIKEIYKNLNIQDGVQT